jgi:hypothetical protein
VQQKTAETLQMASKWETANQQSGPAAVIIPTRFGDSIQQQSSSCVTAASTSSSFPMEVRTQYNLRLNLLFATVAGVGGVYKKPKEKSFFIFDEAMWETELGESMNKLK